MRVSFLSRIKGYFSGRYDGRYIAAVLAEAFAQSPELWAAVFPDEKELVPLLKKGEVTVWPNSYPFIATSERRRFADLAAVHRDRGPLVLCEIKVEDQNVDPLRAQLQDYLEFLGHTDQQDTRFYYLTKYVLEAVDKETLVTSPVFRRTGTLRFYHVYQRLVPKAQAGHPLARMICDYLEDEKMAGFTPLQNVTNDDIFYMLSNFLPSVHAHGHGRKHSGERVDRGPLLLTSLVSNVRLMGEWCREGNESLFRHSFRVNSRLDPWFDVENLEKYLRKNFDRRDREKTSCSLGRTSSCRGGELAIWAQGSMPLDNSGSHSMYFWTGVSLCLDLDAKPADAISTGLFAGVNGPRVWLPDEIVKTDWLDDLSVLDEDKAKRILGKLAHRALQKAVNASASRKLAACLEKLTFPALA